MASKHTFRDVAQPLEGLADQHLTFKNTWEPLAEIAARTLENELGDIDENAREAVDLWLEALTDDVKKKLRLN